MNLLPISPIDCSTRTIETKLRRNWSKTRKCGAKNRDADSSILLRSIVMRHVCGLVFFLLLSFCRAQNVSKLTKRSHTMRSGLLCFYIICVTWFIICWVYVEFYFYLLVLCACFTFCLADQWRWMHQYILWWTKTVVMWSSLHFMSQNGK